MRLSFLMEHYLKAHIDFSTFWLLGVYPQNKHNAAVVLAPRDCSRDIYFNVQYLDKNSYFP